MRREKFTDEEKALVAHAGQSQAERVKIITDIKVAKSNERYSEKMTYLTCVLAFIAVLDFFGHVTTAAQLSAGDFTLFSIGYFLITGVLGLIMVRR